MTRHPVSSTLLALLLGSLAACASTAAPAKPPESPPAAEPARPEPVDPNSAYASKYHPLPSEPVLIVNATILTAAGDRIENGSILLRDGKVAAVGTQVDSTGRRHGRGCHAASG